MTRASDTAKLLGAGATILDGTTISTADNTDSLILTSTDADANHGPNLNLYRNSSSPADLDIIGSIKVVGRNDNSQDVTAFQIDNYLTDVSDGTEDAATFFYVMAGGAIRERLGFGSSAIVFNEDSQDVDFRVESDNLTHALFINGADGKIGLGASTVDSDLHIEKAAAIEIKLERTSSGTSTIGVNDGGQLLINNTSNADLIGSTNNTERFRIKNGGNFLVGTTNQSPAEGTDAGVRLGSNGTSQFSSSGDAGISVNRFTSDGNVMTFRRDGNLRGRIAVDGSSTAYVTSSDYRLKENVNYNFDATSRLKQLKPARFNFIADADKTVDGFLAHEVSSIVPEAISGKKDAMMAEVLYVDGDEIPDDKKVGDVRTASQIDPQGIDHSKLVPLLTKTILELEARITALES